MKIDSMAFRRYRCFRDHFAGLGDLKPVNVIIGRNNSGKSTLLDLVNLMCAEKNTPKGVELHCSGQLVAESLQPHFHQHRSGGKLPGSHWEHWGKQLVGQRCHWKLRHDGSIYDVELPEFEERHRKVPPEQLAEVCRLVGNSLKSAKHEFSGHHFRRLISDRDIRPEAESSDLSIKPNGEGATNVVRRLLLSTSEEFSRDLVSHTLLDALNEIFGEDCHFSEIAIQHHDIGDASVKGTYEIFLGEESKGLVPLSRTGSGLKTILLILLNLLVMPELEKDKSHSGFCFAFEEPENNLHPALLRRLFSFLERHALSSKSLVFLTTHSSTALDVFGVSDSAQLIRVEHDGVQATARKIAAHFDRISVLSELGASPADLLQANGIIWVEGPSDRIYLNRWIELLSGGELSEGKDYQCAFYGGSLLGRVQWTDPETELPEFTNLLRVNNNVTLVCDSDRTAPSGPGSRVKARVRRIRDEVQKIPGALIWVTGAKEIENYLSARLLAEGLKVHCKRDPEQYESFFPSRSGSRRANSYLEKIIGRKSIDKVELSLKLSPLITLQDIENRFDLQPSIRRIIECVRGWSGRNVTESAVSAKP